jgi:hypothetical protein
MPLGKLYPSATEAHQQVLARDAYTLSNMWCRVTFNTILADAVLTSRKNAGAGAQSLTIPAGTTGTFEDTVNSDALASGDLFDARIVAGAGGNNLLMTILSFKLATAANITPIIGAGNDLQAVTALGQYVGVTGSLDSQTLTEARVRYMLRTACTFSNMRAYVTTNTGTSNSVFRLRKNGAFVNEILTVGAGATGSFEDAVNTDVVAAGSDVSGRLGQPAAGTTTVSIVQFKATTDSRLAVCSEWSTVAQDHGVITYQPIEGYLVFLLVANPEANAQEKARVPMTLANLQVYIDSNACGNNSLFRVRKNGANGNQVITVAAGATGRFEDNVHTDSVLATDLVNYAYDLTASAIGTCRATYIGVEQQQGAAPPPKPIQSINSKLVAAGII